MEDVPIIRPTTIIVVPAVPCARLDRRALPEPAPLSVLLLSSCAPGLARTLSLIQQTAGHVGQCVNPVSATMAPAGLSLVRVPHVRTSNRVAQGALASVAVPQVVQGFVLMAQLLAKTLETATVIVTAPLAKCVQLVLAAGEMYALVQPSAEEMYCVVMRRTGSISAIMSTRRLRVSELWLTDQ